MRIRKGRGNNSRALAILVVAGLPGLGAIAMNCRISHRVYKGLFALAAMSPSRPTPGRLSGNIPYAPFAQPDSLPRVRGLARRRQKPKAPETIERKRAKAEIFAADLEHPTARTRADIGVAFLYDGDFPNAVKQLKQAVAKAPGEARIQSDLSVAELALARETGDSEQLLAAAESSSLAMKAGPDIPEVIFNHALALEALHLSNQARRAWDKYLKLDGNSAWAVEARARRAALDEPSPAAQWDRLKGELLRRAKIGDSGGVGNLIEQFPGMARNYVRDELFAAWAWAVKTGDMEFSEHLRRACAVAGETFYRLHNDRFIADAAQILESAGESSRTLSEAHLELRAAQTDYNNNKLAPARRRFEKARAGFAMAGDLAFASYAVIGMASCDFHHYRYQEALRALEGLRPLAKQRDYPNLLGRTWWIAGTIFLKRGETREAIYAYQSALPLYSQTEDWESHAHVSVTSGNAFNILGKTTAAYTYWVDGLENFDRISTASRRCDILKLIAIVLARNRRVEIALNFAMEEMDMAVATRDACQIPYRSRIEIVPI